MGLIINLASNVALSTGTAVGVRMLPVGVRSPQLFSVTTQTTAGTTVSNIAVSGASGASAITCTGQTIGAIPAQSKVYLSDGTFYRTSAANTATSIPIVGTLSATLAAGTTLSFTAGSLTSGTQNLAVTATPVELDAGERLTFGAVVVTISDYTPAGATVLEVLPTTAVLTSGATATTNSLYSVSSVVSCSPNPERKIVETTSYNSGSGMEKLATATGQSVNMTYQIVTRGTIGTELQDRGGNILTNIIYDPTLFNREIFVRIIRSDATYSGVAMVTDGGQQSDLQDRVIQTANLQFQGTNFTRTSNT